MTVLSKTCIVYTTGNCLIDAILRRTNNICFWQNEDIENK